MARNGILAILARTERIPLVDKKGEPVDHKDSRAYWLLTNSERNDYSEPCDRRNWTTYLQFERDGDNQEEARVLFNVELLLTYFHQMCQFHNGTSCLRPQGSSL